MAKNLTYLKYEQYGSGPFDFLMSLWLFQKLYILKIQNKKTQMKKKIRKEVEIPGVKIV